MAIFARRFVQPVPIVALLLSMVNHQLDKVGAQSQDLFFCYFVDHFACETILFRMRRRGRWVGDILLLRIKQIMSQLQLMGIARGREYKSRFYECVGELRSNRRGK